MHLHLLIILCKYVAIFIVNLLLDLYPHVVLINSGELRQKSVDMLQSLYEIRNNLSVEVATALIGCIGVLINVLKNF